MKALLPLAILVLPRPGNDAPPVSVFHLPFPPGVAYHIICGPGEAPHHVSPRNRHAYDFAMPLGSEVTAAAAGVVVKTETRFSGPTGRSENNNFIVLRHEDGLLSEYHHLLQDGALVRVGETVEEGEVIGFSGTSGKAEGPHLHFVVLRREESQPIRFEECKETPSKGQLVLSRNIPPSLSASYSEIEKAQRAVACLKRFERVREAEFVAGQVLEKDSVGSPAERRKAWALRPAREEVERLVHAGSPPSEETTQETGDTP